jgi:transmembrane protein
LHPAWFFNLVALVPAPGVFTVLTIFPAYLFWALSKPARTMRHNSFLEHATISAAIIVVVVEGLHGKRASP